jgi:hypothetical protein
VLWSPVGAPAGVPGPRRNADDCDAGWFAPVATRRRPIFGAFQAPSPWLAVSPRGDDPPEPPAWGGHPARPPLEAQALGGSPCGPEGRFGFPGTCWLQGPVPPRNPSRFFPLAALGRPATRGVWTALSEATRAQPDAVRAGESSNGRAGRLCPETAAGGVGAEFCLRLGHPRSAPAPAVVCAAGGGLAGHGILSVPS